MNIKQIVKVIAGLSFLSLVLTACGTADVDSTGGGGGGGTAPAVTFLAVPNPVAQGNSTTLNWSAPAATSCTSAGDWKTPVSTISGTQPQDPFTVPGTYTYVLTCTNASGTTTQQITVPVTPTTTGGPQINLSASPGVVTTGGSTTVTWSSTNATSCLATSNPSVPSWSVATPSGTKTVAPLTPAGSYELILTCTGAGGSSRNSVIVTASDTSSTVPAVALNAVPNFITSGGASTLNWSSAHASACTASKSWTGAKGTSGTASTGTLSTTGTYVYALTCTGTGGSATAETQVTVSAASGTPAPTVSIVKSAPATATVNPGTSLTLDWTTTNATSCKAIAGDGSANWTPNASRSVPTGTAMFNVPKVPGIYTYGLSCDGPGGTGTGSAAITVQLAGAGCGLTVPATIMTGPPNVTQAFDGSGCGLTLLPCTITNGAFVVDSDTTTTFATISNTLNALTGSATLQVTDNTLATVPAAAYPGGRTVGFWVANPTGLVSAQVLQNITIETYKTGGTILANQSGNLGSTLIVNLLNAVNLPGGVTEQYISYTTPTGAASNFDAVRLVYSPTVGAISSLNVYAACVSLE